jgi:lipopolysaccharide/colanic/teichoic acid biosynthesis glycosyltransferase
MNEQSDTSEFLPLSQIGLNFQPCSRSRDVAECLRTSPASVWILSPTRRFIEICLSLVVLLVFSVPILLVALGVRLTSRGPAFFLQHRVGRKGKLFRICKFRSMTEPCTKKRGPCLTRAGDDRVTLLGRFLRKFKLDELPQFYNVIRGDMSLVGPRPKLPQYVAMQNMSYRPGITGPATLAFRREEELLQSVHPSQLNDFYAENIKPVKARLDACYMCRATPLTDLRIIMETLLGCLRPEGKPMTLAEVSARERRAAIRIYGMPEKETAADVE